MRKHHALLFALLISGLIISEFFLFKSPQVQGSNREEVLVSRIIDGDTLKLADGRTVRLLNINSPEKDMPNSNLASNFLNKFANKTIQIESFGEDKYKRTLAKIYSPNYLNLEIVSLGLASKFLVQESELTDFASAERRAIDNSLGIWQKSEYFGCFSTEIDELKEQVKINNACQDANIKGWFIKDESRKTYYFKDLKFTSITLHSASGEDNSTDIFWNNKGDIWNNDRDSLYLFNSTGGIAGYETYGY